MEFKSIDLNLLDELRPLMQTQRLRMSDYSVGFKIMWSGFFECDVALVNGYAVFRERDKQTGEYYCYYPVCEHSEFDADEAALAEEGRVIDELEEYCKQNEIKLNFLNVSRTRLPFLISRYKAGASFYNSRQWRDYLYDAKDFKEFKGKKYSGQRNHINKFRQKYPDCKTVIVNAENVKRVAQYLKSYEDVTRSRSLFHMQIAEEEIEQSEILLTEMERFGMVGAFLENHDEIVAVAVGERCGDTLIVHIEKALKEYVGAYPTMAHEFACAFADDKVAYINREDDVGEAGLRKSKLQYKPCELIDKYTVSPVRAIDGVERLPELNSERLFFGEIGGGAYAYRTLASSISRNLYWGYDWRSDYEDGRLIGVDDENLFPPLEYFLQLREKLFESKNELSFGIYLKDECTFLGEVVLHNFGYREDAEIGIRLLEKFEKRGYAVEAVRRVAVYAFCELGVEVCYAKCFKQNLASQKMLKNCGMRQTGEDETYFYFSLTAES